MTGHLASSGRGGAGNMVDATKSPKILPKDLDTPTLKTSVVTTGRGGTGNMAKNTDAAETRALQDVKPVERRDSSSAQHGGRGGAGNVYKPSASEVEAAKKAQQDGSAVDDEPKKPHEKNLVEKVKDSILGKK